jgi:hypothetical protein
MTTLIFIVIALIVGGILGYLYGGKIITDADGDFKKISTLISTKIHYMEGEVTAEKKAIIAAIDAKIQAILKKI